MKLLFLAWRELANERSGGSEILVDRLASELSARGHEVTVAAGGAVGSRSYPVVSLGGTYAQFIRAPMAYARRWRDVELVVDVTNGMSFLTPLWRRKPVLCWVNHDHRTQWGQWFSPPLDRVGRTIEHRLTPFLYRDRLTVALSTSTAAHLTSLGIDPSRIRLVNPGVSDPCLDVDDAVEPEFVACGRLVPHKRFDDLLLAWEEVRRNLGRGTLTLIGDGPMEQSLRGHPGVHVAGRVPNGERDRLMARAWALVHTSLVEGWGLAIMEAAVVGTPTIALDVPGVRDSVINGSTGLLGSGREELVANWLRLATDDALRRRLGDSARDRARRFTWENTADAFEQVANEAVREAGHPRRTGLSGRLARSPLR